MLTLSDIELGLQHTLTAPEARGSSAATLPVARLDHDGSCPSSLNLRIMQLTEDTESWGSISPLYLNATEHTTVASVGHLENYASPERCYVTASCLDLRLSSPSTPPLSRSSKSLDFVPIATPSVSSCNGSPRQMDLTDPVKALPAP